MIYVAMGLLVVCALMGAAVTGAIFDDTNSVGQLTFGLLLSAVLIATAIAIKP